MPLQRRYTNEAMSNCRTISIMLIVLTYTLIQGVCFQEVGAAGEVAIGWSSTPNVVVNTHPIEYDNGAPWGIFHARETRPTETVHIGEFSIPITINSYTSAIPDWPSFILYTISESPSLIRGFHIVLGGVLLLLCFSLFGGQLSFVMALLLATDWMFLFYKQILGGTELCLQLASMGILWVMVHKRSWGWLIFWMAWGLQAKITFVFVIVPVIVTIGIFQIKLPFTHIKRSLGVGALLIIPLLISAYHHIDTSNVVRSHDTWAMQWNRIVMAFSGSTTEALREQSINLWHWMVHPLSFYERIYELPSSWEWISWIRSIGWILCGYTVILHRKNPQIRMYSTLFVFLVLSICFGPKDLHHYAMIAPFWAFWVAKIVQQRQWNVLYAPFVASGLLFIVHTDTVLEQVQVPTFNTTKQRELQEMLTQQKVEKLVTMDYEVYGLLEYQQQEITVLHGWGAISHKRYHALPELLLAAKGGHLIVLESSMPMRYNLRPTLTMLKEAAQKRNLHIEVQSRNLQWLLIQVHEEKTEDSKD